MNKQRAREILGKSLGQHGRLSSDEIDFLRWEPGDDTATLDGYFTADQLEAIAWWMRNTKEAT